MPKTHILDPAQNTQFFAFPSETRQIRGQSTLDVGKLYATKTIYITKTARGWGPTKTETPFVLRIARSLLTAKRHYVFRFDVNEVEQLAECHKLASFTHREWAEEFMRTGTIECQGPCSHNQECKQRLPVLADSSPYWEVGCFLVSNKKLVFSAHIWKYGATSATPLRPAETGVQ